VVLDIKRHALFGGPIFYEGETGFANLRLQFPEDSGIKNYGTSVSTRSINWFSQHIFWLAVVSCPGLDIEAPTTARPGISDQQYLCRHQTRWCPHYPAATINSQSHQVCWGHVSKRLRYGRGSFVQDLSKMGGVQSRAFGLDGLMHVFQPFTDFSYVKKTVLIPFRFCNSIDLNLLRSFGQSIFHSSPRLIRLPTGRSGAVGSATSWKPGGTIQR
jgi:hypothetical protein